MNFKGFVFLLGGSLILFHWVAKKEIEIIKKSHEELLQRIHKLQDKNATLRNFEDFVRTVGASQEMEEERKYIIDNANLILSRSIISDILQGIFAETGLNGEFQIGEPYYSQEFPKPIRVQEIPVSISTEGSLSFEALLLFLSKLREAPMLIEEIEIERNEDIGGLQVKIEGKFFRKEP